MTAVKETRQRGMAVTIGSTAVAKVVVMGLSGVLGIITSRLIIQHFGTAAYAQYGLLSSFPGLLPFADLGIAAVVINVIAGSRAPREDEEVRRTITTALRILMVSGSIIIACGLIITFVGWWPVLLGNGLLPEGGSLAACLCLVVFGIALPLTVGQRILVALQKTTTQVASQSVVAPFMLLSILTLVALSAPAGSYLAVLSYIGNALVSVICLIVAARALSPQMRLALRDVFRVKTVRGVGVIGLAWPMLIQMIALPVAMQTDRLLLSHLTTGPQLAQYNLASQLFGIILQTIAAAGLALWPFYARARSASRVESPFAPTLWFLGGGVLLGLALAALSPFVTHFIAGDKIVLDGWLLFGFVAFVGLQAAKYPIGMYMTDKRGLVFQVLPIVLMIPLNLGLSWLLIGALGAAGTVIGSAVAVLVCQVIPNLLYVQHDVRTRRRINAELRESGE
jgi:O-antigen/teichoic acid export membrane protein